MPNYGAAADVLWGRARSKSHRHAFAHTTHSHPLFWPIVPARRRLLLGDAPGEEVESAADALGHLIAAEPAAYAALAGQLVQVRELHY